MLGSVASFTYFLINTIFLAKAVFGKEDRLSRFLLGSFFLVLLLGLASWIMMIIYNLDIWRSTIVLVAIAVFSSISIWRREKNQQSTGNNQSDMQAKQSVPAHVYFMRVSFLFIFALSFYLLFLARLGEVYTVWYALNAISISIYLPTLSFVMVPIFLLAYFATTLLLVVIVLSCERTSYKLIFVIVHSILSHTLFVIIFPAGDIGGQQIILSITRRIYENLTIHGHGHSANVLVQIYYWSKGTNFQSAYSVIFARMFSVDVFWSHLALIPILWGVFVPAIMYKIAKTLGACDTVAVLSSLMILAFPATIYWGTFSVPNSLGFIFTLGSIYFILRYISSNSNNSHLLMLIFAFASLISHLLTGIITVALLLLAVAIKKYLKERVISPKSSRFFLFIAFILSVSLLPLSLVYHKLLSPLYAVFSLYLLRSLPIQDLIGMFIMGDYYNYGPFAIILFVSGPLLGLAGIIYVLYAKTRQNSNKYCTLCAFFLLMSFLLVLADYRILRLFMAGVPFKASRVSVFRDFIAAPFLAIGGYSIFSFVQRKMPLAAHQMKGRSARAHVSLSKSSLRSIIVYTLLIISISGWITASFFFAYPHYAPLQITSYEIEAVKYIEATTNMTYVVIGDQWIIFTGHMFLGAYNPRAYYLAGARGILLFIEMKNNPSPEVMVEAMKYNNATVAYFIIEKPRLGTETYTHIIQQAQQNGLQTYTGGVFYYKGEEKLRIFYQNG